MKEIKNNNEDLNEELNRVNKNFTNLLREDKKREFIPRLYILSWLMALIFTIYTLGQVKVANNLFSDKIFLIFLAGIFLVFSIESLIKTKRTEIKIPILITMGLYIFTSYSIWKSDFLISNYLSYYSYINLFMYCIIGLLFAIIALGLMNNYGPEEGLYQTIMALIPAIVFGLINIFVFTLLLMAISFFIIPVNNYFYYYLFIITGFISYSIFLINLQDLKSHSNIMDSFIEIILSLISIIFMIIIIYGIINKILKNDLIFNNKIWKNYFAYSFIIWLTYILNLSIINRRDKLVNFNLSNIIIKFFPFLNLFISIAILTIYFLFNKSHIFTIGNWFVIGITILNIFSSIYMIRNKLSFKQNWAFLLLVFLIVVISPIGPFKASEANSVKILEKAKVENPSLFLDGNINYTKIYEKSNKIILDNLAYLNKISAKAKNYASKYTLTQLENYGFGIYYSQNTYIYFQSEEDLNFDISRYNKFSKLKGQYNYDNKNRIQIENENIYIYLNDQLKGKLSFDVIRKSLEDSNGKEIDIYTSNNNRLIFEIFNYQEEDDYNIEGYYFYGD